MDDYTFFVLTSARVWNNVSRRRWFLVDKKEGDQGNVGHQHGMNINVNLDTTPILYTDNIFISVNESGIVLDFTQQLASTNQARIVSRIGMSRDHAKKFAEQFEAMLKVAEGKAQTAEKKIKTN